MRAVSSPRGVPSGEAPLLVAEALDSVRDLGGRFPAAHLREVPVVRAADLDLRADPSGATRVWLALEAMQVTGSFKVRGALVALAAILARGVKEGRKPRVVAASAGNHGAGVAYAAEVLDVEATIVMPRSAPRRKKDRAAAYGAEVVLAPSDHYDDAEALAQKLAHERGATFVSPYDDLDVVLGNGASLGFEIVRAMGGVPEIVLAPFGGGGLATGLACAFADEADVPPETARHVWGVQSEASPAMAMSLERNAAVERFTSSVPTLAEGLEGGISRAAFARARRAIAGVVVVSEDDIASAMAYAHREMGLVLEGSAATVLVPLLTGLPPLLRADAGPLAQPGRRPHEAGVDLVAVLTGRNVDRDRLEGALHAGARPIAEAGE